MTLELFVICGSRQENVFRVAVETLVDAGKNVIVRDGFVPLMRMADEHIEIIDRQVSEEILKVGFMAHFEVVVGSLVH